MYDFVGLFSTAGMPFRDAAIVLWPGADVVSLTEPYVGSALRFADQLPAGRGEESPAPELAAGIVEMSRRCPNDAIVYVEAECSGGICGYRGRVYREGRTASEETGRGALSRLLSHLGLQLDEHEYFEPFRRDFRWTG
jgi:hypothetical protein